VHYERMIKLKKNLMKGGALFRDCLARILALIVGCGTPWNDSKYKGQNGLIITSHFEIDKSLHLYNAHTEKPVAGRVFVYVTRSISNVACVMRAL